MTGVVTTDTPGQVGPLGQGWTVELDAMPNSATQSSPSTGVVNFTAEADADAHLLMGNASTFTYVDEPSVDFQDTLVPEEVWGVVPGMTYNETAGGTTTYGKDAGFGFGWFGGNSPGGGYNHDGYGGINTGGYNRDQYGASTYNDPGQFGWVETPTVITAYADPVITGTITGSIDSVSLQGETGTFTQSTELTQFAGADFDIQSVTSGSPLGALYLAWQMAGNTPCNYADVTGVYWPLRGHDIGFDWQNKPVYAQDNSLYRLFTDGATTYRSWNVVNSYASRSWVEYENDIWSASGVGSSVSCAASQRTIIVGTTMLDSSTQFSFNLGTNATDGSSLTDLGFGPDSGVNSYGKWFNILWDGVAQTVTMTGQYRSGGDYASVNKSVSISSLDMTKPIQIVIDCGFSSSNTFLLAAYTQNVGTIDDPEATQTPVVVTTGALSTAVDAYAQPWTHTGYLQGVYQVSGAYPDFDPNDFLGEYEQFDSMSCDLDSLGIGTPILGYTGTLWDYLTQICLARLLDLRIVSGTYELSSMNDKVGTPQAWTPAVSPTFAIDNTTTATTVEIDASIVDYTTDNPVVMDALDPSNNGTSSYSATPGTTAQFSITTSCIDSLIYNPEPLYDVNDFLTGDHPYGAYIVSGPDNLPIEPDEWISYGGSLTIQKSGINTITVTVVAPNIPLPTTGDFSISVSDGSTSYPMLKLTSVTGGKITTQNTIFQTGANNPNHLTGKHRADRKANNSANLYSGASQITNIAATDIASVQALAGWAVSVATGPNLTLTGEFPMEDMKTWDGNDIGVLPGSTILYENLMWRITVATISHLSVKFTAVPFTVYGSGHWDINWDGYTVDDFADFWDGKTYDDLLTEPLRGPVYDWSYDGAISRFALYPSGGEGITLDLGVEPGSNTLPSTTLDPDSPSSLGGVLGNTFPGTADFPGAGDYPTSTTTTSGLLPALFPSPTLAPGSEEE